MASIAYMPQTSKSKFLGVVTPPDQHACVTLDETDTYERNLRLSFTHNHSLSIQPMLLPNLKSVFALPLSEVNRGDVLAFVS